jgi:neutral ceramidase
VKRHRQARLTEAYVWISSKSEILSAKPRKGKWFRNMVEHIFQIRYVVLCLVLLGLPLGIEGATLKAGVAKVDITPGPGKYMLGSGDVLATGAHDPLYARVLVLDVGEKRLAFVTLDLCRVFQKSLIAKLREEASEQSGISYVLLTASHTHSAPIIPIDDNHPIIGMVAWQSEAIEKVVKAINEAHRNVVDARLGTGYGVAYIGHNRRRLRADGSVSMMWANPTKIPTSPVDPVVSILRVDTLDAKPLAILVNYAAHPVVIMANLKEYSADYPGVMCRTVEQAFGNQPLCMFMQGAAGDIDTYYTGVPIEQDPVKWMEWTGQQLGREAVRVAKNIQTEAVPDPSLEFAEDLLTFHFRWNPEKYTEAFNADMPISSPLHEYYMPSTAPEQKLPVATILIDKRIAMIGVPGEAFVQFQMNWRQRCPVSDCFFLGYSNGFFSYLPTIRAATEGGHGANNVWARIEPGAPEQMVNHALIRLYEMLGRLRDSPVTSKKK